MAESRFNFIGILIALVSAFASAFLLAILAGVFLGLFGAGFVDEQGNTSIVFDGLFYLLFVLPPYLICGFVAAHFGANRKILHALIAGLCLLLVLIAMAFLPSDESEAMGFSDYFIYIAVLPLSLIGAWLYVRIAG
jgi:hypothetical protein